MSRASSRKKSFMSPAQRRACVVVVLCVVAIVLSFVLSWIVLPDVLGSSQESDYDPNLYPLDTSLSAILPQGTEATDYMAGTVFVGDRYAASLQTQNLITLDQFAGAKDLSLGSLLSQACVSFQGDPNTYTVPQALAKMKPRRVVLMLGNADTAGGSISADSFVGQYRQVVSAIRQAYPHCDIIVSAVAPVRENAQGSAAAQTTVDACNQALAAMCQSDGLPFLNTTETLKASSGFAQDSYFDNGDGSFTASGGNAVLMYFRQHPYITEDRRPDTNDIPHRAAQPAAAGDASQPTPTPAGIAATYTVEDSARGSLTTTITEGLAPGAAVTNVSRLEYEVPERTTITVTATPADGWVFLRWSDGQTSPTRTDIVTAPFSVVAVFGQPTIRIRLNGSPCDNGQDLTGLFAAGGSYSLTAEALLNGVVDSAMTAKLEWVINRDEEPYDGNQFGGSYTFTPAKGGTYDIIVGLVLDGAAEQNVVSSYVFATVPDPTPTPPPPTEISITYDTNTVTAGQTVHLTASVTNGSGTTSWSCDGQPWSAQGDTATFTAPNVTETTPLTVHARNNGAEATVTITVNPVQAPPAQQPAQQPTQQPPAQGGDAGEEHDDD